MLVYDCTCVSYVSIVSKESMQNLYTETCLGMRLGDLGTLETKQRLTKESEYKQTSKKNQHKESTTND